MALSHHSSMEVAENGISSAPTPKATISRSESDSTFVHADKTSFKQVVQMLTGPNKAFSIPPKKQVFKLHERRNNLKNGLMINPFVPSRNNKLHEILSPSILDFPSLALNNSPSPSEEEEKAIADKKFYLHPSPTTKNYSQPQPQPQPQLLSLFPLTSPKIDGDASS